MNRFEGELLEVSFRYDDGLPFLEAEVLESLLRALSVLFSVDENTQKLGGVVDFARYHSRKLLERVRRLERDLELGPVQNVDLHGYRNSNGGTVTPRGIRFLVEQRDIVQQHLNASLDFLLAFFEHGGIVRRQLNRGFF